MSMTKTDKQALRDNANSIIGILENIAGYEPSDIDGDNVELRFEDECGVDTGCDVSIVDQSQKTADVMRALLDELEAKDKRIAEQAMLLEGSDAILADYAETLDCAGDTDSILAGIVELQSRAEAAEKRIANPDQWTRDIEETLIAATDRNTELEARIAELEAKPANPINFKEGADADYCRLWAWNEIKKELISEEWTVGDNCNYYGFFCWGWDSRRQFNEQRAAGIALDTGE
ncbi:ead/Ea22-like family protein [Scandinavium sp. H11S7]|uniref:Ead/Ea22-like family protein n=1 Tax=Scandinavium hiltneri TaxID=2926519 RepID=A0ABT2E1B4_9ENTR|nr:ead/Ea22-like family protein [Scandinavium hiltneri]MCS2161679.1 ead/Ea22-like family protein [Scandinavium hiltneri]